MNHLLQNDLYPIFILIMIISANFLAEIFPCRFQELLNSNNYIKHIFGYLTLVFFVSLNIQNLNTNLSQLFTKSLYLYIGFLLLSKTNKHIFMTILILLALLYIIHLKKTIELQNNKNNKQSPILQNLESYSLIIKKSIFTLLIIGFILYLGEKKYEYKKQFNYLTFLFGKPNCKGSSPNIDPIKAFQKAFTP